jgi:beta-glucosidase/6-phospho-beta-glucosidase/beta-galactosidase
MVILIPCPFDDVSEFLFQIEGAYLDDTKGLSNWDTFTHIQGALSTISFASDDLIN